MIYNSVALLCMLGLAESYTPCNCVSIVGANPSYRYNIRPRKLSLAVASISPKEETDAPMINVRFINTVSGKDVVTKAHMGANLMVVGDSAGVKLPRACRTGLCGSCTCDLMDPQAIQTTSNSRDGFATIRACSAKCFVPEGMDEMVIDVYRMGGKGRRPDVPSTPSAVDEPQETQPTVGFNTAKNHHALSYYICTVYILLQTNPMARFSGNWEKEFRPNWELMNDFSSGQVGGASSGSRDGPKQCTMCRGLKRLQCYNCNATGKVMMGNGQVTQCSICVGSMSVGCAYCKGTGVAAVKKTRQ